MQKIDITNGTKNLWIGNLAYPYIMLDKLFSLIELFIQLNNPKFFDRFKNHKGIIITDHYFLDFKITDKNFILQDCEKISVQNTLDLIKKDYWGKMDSSKTQSYR